MGQSDAATIPPTPTTEPNDAVSMRAPSDPHLIPRGFENSGAGLQPSAHEAALEQQVLRLSQENAYLRRENEYLRLDNEWIRREDADLSRKNRRLRCQVRQLDQKPKEQLELDR